MTKDSKTNAVKCILTLLDFTVITSVTLFSCNEYTRKWEYAIFYAFIQACGVQTKTRINIYIIIFIKSQTLKDKKASQSYR